MKTPRYQGGWIGAAIAAGASLYGAAQQNNARQDMATAATAFNAQQAEINRRLQKQSIKRSHQWQVRDLRKAGLNPILAAGGSGAAPQAGAPAQAVMPDLVDEVGPAVGSALQATKQGAEIENLKATTIRTLGETSKGQMIINEIGGAEQLARRLNDDPELFSELTELMNSGMPDWLDKAAELLIDMDDESVWDLQGPDDNDDEYDLTRYPTDGTDRRRGWGKREHKDDVNRYKKRFGIQYPNTNHER